MLMGIPFRILGDRVDDRVLDCLMKVWILHGLGLFTLNIGYAGRMNHSPGLGLFKLNIGCAGGELLISHNIVGLFGISSTVTDIF